MDGFKKKKAAKKKLPSIPTGEAKRHRFSAKACSSSQKEKYLSQHLTCRKEQRAK